jgi:hypothetical protein
MIIINFIMTCQPPKNANHKYPQIMRILMIEDPIIFICIIKYCYI